MTLFYKNYEPSFLEKISNKIFGVKLYPAGLTTNSSGGVASFNIKEMSPTLEALENLNLPLLIHGESEGFVMDREENFASIYEDLAKTFPKLKIVMEHITTKKLARLLDKYENLFATITLHHLFITLDDVIGGSLNPHLFCKPIAKRPQDRDALLDLALKAHPKVMFGSDSAPHTRENKLECGCAGVFSAPVALSILAQLFATHSTQDKLQAFISDNAIKIHSLKVPQKSYKLVEKKWQVPASYHGIIPYAAGTTLAFKVENDS